MSADELRAKFALTRFRTANETRLQQLVAGRRWKEAQTLADQLGVSVSRGVIRLSDVMARR